MDDVGVEHLQVHRLGRHITRLCHQVSAQILIGQGVGQLGQFMVVVHGRRPHANIKVHDKWSAVARRKNWHAIANAHISLRVAGMDGKLGRRLGYRRHNLVFCQEHLLPIHLDPMLLKDRQGLLIGKEDTNLGQHLHAGLVNSLDIALA